MNEKYKEAGPEESIRRITEAFREIGVSMKERVFRPGEGVVSLNLADEAHGWQVNGKGTELSWARASAWGEAAERFQNRAPWRPIPLAEDDFLYWPDEELRPAEAAAEREDAAADFLSRCAEKDSRGAWDFLRAYAGADRILFVPFRAMREDRNVPLSADALTLICGTNGMAAGNTEGEAFCQAMSEIAERYAKFEIFRRRMTPPRLSEEEIGERSPEGLETIRRVRERSGCDLAILDCSLGRELPVLGLRMIDRARRRFTVRFGAHPRFEIALERCLTEMGQGLADFRDLSRLIPWPPREPDYDSFRNLIGTFRTDAADWPEAFFGENPSWEPNPWREETFTNEAAGRRLAERLTEDGRELYLRRTGFLGIPAVQVYIPGVSSLPFRLGRKNLRYAEAREKLRDPAALCGVTGAKEAEELLEAMTSPDSSVCSRCDPETGMPMPAWQLRSLLLCAAGRDREAAGVIAAALDRGAEDARMACLEAWLEMGLRDVSDREAALRAFFGAETAGFVLGAVRDRAGLMAAWTDPAGLWRARKTFAPDRGEELLRERRLALEKRIHERLKRAMPAQKGLPEEGPSA